jgi:hypothetical protein
MSVWITLARGDDSEPRPHGSEEFRHGGVLAAMMTDLQTHPNASLPNCFPQEVRVPPAFQHLPARGWFGRRSAAAKPSRMPLANAAAIATAGSLMARFAVLLMFQCEMSAGTDRTNAFP